MDAKQVSRRGIPVDHDECARRHLAQAQVHLDLAAESLAEVVSPVAETRLAHASIGARCAISALYSVLNAAKKRARRAR